MTLIAEFTLVNPAGTEVYSIDRDDCGVFIQSVLAPPIHDDRQNVISFQDTYSAALEHLGVRFDDAQSQT